MAFSFQVPWGWMKGKRFRTLIPIATTIGHKEKGGTEIPVGTVVICTMVSGREDVGVSTDLSRTQGYDHRAYPWQLERVEDEEYIYVFDKDNDPLFKNRMFTSSYVDRIATWTPEVLNRSWWEK